MSEDSKPNPEDFAPKGTGVRTPSSQAHWLYAKSSPEEPVVIIGSDDLAPEAKTTLAHYLSHLTKEAPRTNAFPIVANPVGEFSISTQDGSGTPAITAGTNPGFLQTVAFASNEGSAASTLFETLSDSGNFVSLGSLINKIARSPHGHQILSDFKANAEPFELGVGDTTGKTFLPTPGNAGKLQQQVSQALKKNRFSPTSNTPYIDNGAFSDAGAIVPAGLGTSQAVSGEKYDYNSGENAGDVGSILTILQTGHSAAEAAGSGLMFVPPATVMPTMVQTGFSKVGMEKLYASNVVGFKRTQLQGELRYSGAESFGAMNSWHEPFEGAGLAAMMTAGASLAACLGVAMIFGIIFELMAKFLDDKLDVKNFKPARLPMGGSGFSSYKAAAFTGCGVPVTKNGFAMCLMTGLASFLGVPFGDWPKAGEEPGMLPGSTIGAYFLKVAVLLVSIVFGLGANAGYLSVLGRVVNRDFMGVLDAFKETFSSPMGLITAALNLVGLIAGISSSVAFRFFMALAVAGDKALQALDTMNATNYERLLPTGQTRIMKGRENAYDVTLAWRQQSAPGALILPTQIATAFGVFDRGIGTPDAMMEAWGGSRSLEDESIYGYIARKNHYAGKGGRLDPINVTLLENALEAEYMPFYFHDLRTNEIISFHAFLDDIKDSYSVNYAETGGYGRIDKVKIYQDTTRDINVAFWVVATNKDDFSSMWWSINKLITLLYPQWSMGTQVVSDKLNFVQPFSQIPTASPMIRLRVGDVIKSNYSRFNLARLFGLAEAKSAPGGDPYGDLRGFRGIKLPEFEPDDPPPEPIFNVSEEVIDSEQAKQDRARIAAQKKRHAGKKADKGGFEKGERVRFPNLVGDTQMFVVTVLEDKDDLPLDVNIPYKVKANGIPGKIKKIIEKGKKGAGALNDLAKTDDLYLIEPDEAILGLNPNMKLMFKHNFGKQGGRKRLLYWITGGALSAEENQNGPYPGWKTETNEFPYADQSEEQMSAIQNFFSPAENPIVRSFESTMGRGLAGFITSFDMDWNDSIWEVEGIGNRAPTAVKISINFAPTHDIAPGIDNHGFARAINYPVGRIAATFGQDQHDQGYGGQQPMGKEHEPGFVNAEWFYNFATSAKSPPQPDPKVKDGKKG